MFQHRSSKRTLSPKKHPNNYPPMETVSALLQSGLAIGVNYPPASTTTQQRIFWFLKTTILFISISFIMELLNKSTQFRTVCVPNKTNVINALHRVLYYSLGGFQIVSRLLQCVNIFLQALFQLGDTLPNLIISNCVL